MSQITNNIPANTNNIPDNTHVIRLPRCGKCNFIINVDNRILINNVTHTHCDSCTYRGIFKHFDQNGIIRP